MRAIRRRLAGALGALALVALPTSTASASEPSYYSGYADSMAAGLDLFALSTGSNTPNVGFLNRARSSVGAGPDAQGRAAVFDLGYNGDLVPLACVALIGSIPGGCPETPLLAVAAYPSGASTADGTDTVPAVDLGGQGSVTAASAHSEAGMSGDTPKAIARSSAAAFDAAGVSIGASSSVSDVHFEGSSLVATTAVAVKDVKAGGTELFSLVRSSVTVRAGGEPGSASISRSFEAVSAGGGLVTLSDQKSLGGIAQQINGALGSLAAKGLTVTFLPGGETVASNGTRAAGIVGGLHIEMQPNALDTYSIDLAPASAEAKLTPGSDVVDQPLPLPGVPVAAVPPGAQPPLPGPAAVLAPSAPITVPRPIAMRPPVTASVGPASSAKVAAGFRDFYGVLAGIALLLLGTRKVMRLASRE